MQIKNHPLESVFGIAQGSMNLSHNQELGFSLDDQNEMIEAPEPVQAVPHEDDAEDKEIREQIIEVYDMAMDAYRNQTEMFETCEPRYAARTQEVANQSLSIALNAVALRSKNKNEKRKSSTFIPFGNNISNSQIVMADRNSLLEMMAERKKIESNQ